MVSAGAKVRGIARRRRITANCLRLISAAVFKALGGSGRSPPFVRESWPIRWNLRKGRASFPRGRDSPSSGTRLPGSRLLRVTRVPLSTQTSCGGRLGWGKRRVCPRAPRRGRPLHRPRVPFCSRQLQWCLVHRSCPRPGLSCHQRSPEKGRCVSRRGVRGHIWACFGSR